VDATHNARMKRWTLRLLVLLTLLVLATLAAGRAGLLRGPPPAALGVEGGRLAAPSAAPNSVSSQTMLWPGHPQAAYARIAPLPARGDAAATMARLRQTLAAMPGAEIVEARPDYVYARFTTRWLRFVDDAEFWFDPVAGVVQLRSASRLGRSDLGANRARIEALRAAWTAAP
jgi:uncharacterized protein (DUF1499 family)